METFDFKGMMGLGKIKLFDSNHLFRFTCDMCGICCFDIQIMLCPYDIIQITKKLKISSREFLKEYCELILGSQTKLPLPLIKMNPFCPFLEGNLCGIYEDRPLRCRSYPIGRIVKIDKKSKLGEVKFFFQKNCSKLPLRKQKLRSIKQWLDQEKVWEYYEISDLWNNFLAKLSEQGYPKNNKEFENFFIGIFYDVDTALKKVPEFLGIRKPETPKEKMNCILLIGKTYLKTKFNIDLDDGNGN